MSPSQGLESLKWGSNVEFERCESELNLEAPSCESESNIELLRCMSEFQVPETRVPVSSL